jgi:hypothetical protein
MRYFEFLSEQQITPKIDPKKLDAAKADGFLTDKVWYHGTKRRFSNFRAPKGRGIDELGKGIYITQFVGTANVWAQGQGLILACVLREGKLVELSEVPKSGLWHRGNQGHDVWQEAYQGYLIYLAREYQEVNLEAPTQEYREFAEEMNRGKISLSRCLAEVGYIGATDRYSQIRAQAVIWNPEDIRVIGRMPGIEGYHPD